MRQTPWDGAFREAGGRDRVPARASQGPGRVLEAGGDDDVACAQGSRPERLAVEALLRPPAPRHRHRGCRHTHDSAHVTYSQSALICSFQEPSASRF